MTLTLEKIEEIEARLRILVPDVVMPTMIELCRLAKIGLKQEELHRDMTAHGIAVTRIDPTEFYAGKPDAS